jgi:hypothetical protein
VRAIVESRLELDARYQSGKASHDARTRRAVGLEASASATPGSHVLVLLDARGRPRGKTHALDCHMAPTFHWAKGRYETVRARDIPDWVPPCGFCGGGR